MILDLLITLFSSLLFLFVFWTRLKEDYTQNQIFTTGLYILFGLGFGNLLADNLFRSWWFWTGFAGGFFGLTAGIKRFRLRFFETLEAFVISGLSVFLTVSFSDLMKEYSLISLLLTLGIMFFIGLFLFLDKHYKKFYWYKSGRVGFSGLTVLGLFFLVRTAVAMSGISVLSFAGESEVVISGMLAFISFISVYNLSGKS